MLSINYKLSTLNFYSAAYTLYTIHYTLYTIHYTLSTKLRPVPTPIKVFLPNLSTALLLCVSLYVQYSAEAR